MLIAAGPGKDGRKMLILGLDQEGLELLKNDNPIHKNMKDEKVPGLEEWDVYILGPEDTFRFQQEVVANNIEIRRTES